MIELCPLKSMLKSGIWPILGLKLAILAPFFKISTSNLIGKPNRKSIGPKITSLAFKERHKWPYLNFGRNGLKNFLRPKSKIRVY